MEHFDKKAIDQKVAEGLPFAHPLHNRFHLEMPFGLINDPNGLSCAGGEYHIFFQWNPLGCVHKNKCWAHTKTRDFVHYRVPELSLWPSDEHDKDGCYSGCGFAEDGAVRVCYTCNAKNDGVRTSAQRFGTLEADGTVRKDAIAVPGSPDGITEHFRDPYLFYRHGKRYFIIGAQADGEHPRGTALLYEEQKGGWKNRGELKTRLTDFGYMWECPNLLRFGDHDVLIFCPQGLPAREYDRQNRYQAGYIVGRMSLDSMDLLQHTKFQELDHGFDFYAPQVVCHEGRHILIGWMGMPDKDEEYPTAEAGWRFSLTMPRVLTLRQGHIYSHPVKELRTLRIESTAKGIDAEMEKSVRETLFAGSEVLLNVMLGEARHVSATLTYGQEKLVFSYDRNEQAVTIDRTGMKKGGRGIRRFRLFADRTLHLHLFVDKTAVEAFFQHGEEAASLFVFPEKEVCPELILESDAPMESVTGCVWELDAIRFDP